MFTPTKQHLEELEFELNELWYEKYVTSLTFLTYKKNTWLIWTKPLQFMWEQDNRFRNFYPQSIDDIKTLIKMLTPPNN